MEEKDMKALLIGINSKYIHPSVSLYQLRANTTYECDLIELTIKDSLDTIISKLNKFDLSSYHIFACSCYLWNIDKYLELIPVLKTYNSSAKIVFGGPEVAYDANYFLSKFSYIDYILEGEGELSFHELLEYLDNKRSINDVSNLHYKEDNILKFTYAAHPDLNKISLATLDIKDYQNRIIYLESSRGCPYHCSYCTASLDNKVRYFPLEKVLNILYTLMINKTKVVKFLDRTFNANYEYMMQILDFIDMHNICTVFQFEVVGELVKEETINRIAKLKSKYLRFEIGIQSTNNIVNEAVCRRQNMDKLKKNIFLLNKTNKVDLHIDLIAGLPYETKESFINSFNEAFLLRGKELQLGFLKFLRGTKMLDMVDEHEYKYSNKAPYEIISNKYLSNEDLKEIEMVEKSLNRYYNSGILPKLFNYLLDNNLVSSYYEFFKGLYKELEHYQKDELFKILDDYLKLLFPENYDYLHHILLIDYLENFKVKPKIWWDYKKIENREELFNTICMKIPSLSLELLYRYSVVLIYKNEVFLIIYKDFNNSSFIINL
jgi:radical SAM superfamily enzyme YgiQ (UPF0313 family)